MKNKRNLNAFYKSHCRFQIWRHLRFSLNNRTLGPRKSFVYW